MLVSLIKDGKIRSIILPNRINGTYWITDYDESSNEKNLISIEAKDNSWVLTGNYEYGIVENKMDIPYVVLNNYQFYVIRDIRKNSYMLLYTSPVYDTTNNVFDCSKLSEITIGSDSNNLIRYQHPYISSLHAKLVIENNTVSIIDNQSKFGVYVNNRRISGTVSLNFGDVVYIMGLKIIVISEKNQPFIIFNNPNGLVKYPMDVFNMGFLDSSKKEELETTEKLDATLYTEDDYFHKKPRFHSTINTLTLNIDPPPNKKDGDDRPVLLTIGPMLTMGMTSGVIAFSTINNIQNGKTTWMDSLPSLVMAGAMLASMLIWPILTKRYEKRRLAREEKQRQEKYSLYIDNKRKLIESTIQKQRQTLIQNNPTLNECQQIILEKKFNLWERKPEEEDFLTVSLGMGVLPMSIDIHYPEEHFSMDDDNLKEIVSKLGSEPKNLVDVPITLNLYKKYLSAMIGSYELNHSLIEKILLQLITFHSYDDLKIVILTNKDNEKDWEFMKILPHNWSNDHSIRYFGTTSNEVKEIGYHLDHEFSSRNEREKVEWKSQISKPYYLIITDDFKKVRGHDFIQNILNQKTNSGFSFMILNDKVTNLPSECQIFLNVTQNHSELFENILNTNIQQFQIDFVTNINLVQCCQTLANIPIELENQGEGQLPNKYTLLEMYDVGKIEQLNPLNRWKKSNPMQTLQAPIGVGKNMEIISLDLHEKFHGPHGLIAGMTGSGKSEFIITYILSMAINYHPDEVQFILIDYKGGGLAGAFENKETGIRLPHLVGTITNLDANEINRSLASIESELKRRQKAFNEARELSGESTIDIYKYQKLYRAGIVKNPISHLFIISDEFAELKSQQPEFMQQLISTARIGRSLGVHLILATQKPSGVVDNQIWSNTRFRVCLRVQEKSDSTEVIKCPDAAYLTQTGRFYLQVGFNEIFSLGQAAWCGANYIPSEKLIKKIDTSLDFVDNIGFVIKNIDYQAKQESVPKIGEELTNIVKYLGKISLEENIKERPLWLDRIPNQIFVDKLRTKYDYKEYSFYLDPLVGEYDVPNQQSQYPLNIPISENGNVLIYGIAGSGKENFLSTLLYSIMSVHSPEEVNCYIMDFGSESLRMFQNMPHVGDIIMLSEDDKINNLFKLLLQEIDTRKKKFFDFNGDYNSYVKNSGKTLPNILVLMNNYEAFSETYDKYSDLFSQLTREGTRYGIYFVMTVTTPNGVRIKLRQSFNQIFSLEQNNEIDYSTIIGNINKKYPSKNFGRGIFKADGVYEFQTALITIPEDLASFIKKKSIEWNEQYKNKAKKIPILPEIVRFSDYENQIIDSDSLLIGIDKEQLLPVTYPFQKHFVDIVMSQDITILFPLAEQLIKQVLHFKKSSVIVINAEEADFTFDKQKVRYYDQQFDIIYEQLEKIILTYYDAYQKNNYNRSIFDKITPVICIIVGIDSFRSKLSNEHKNAFSTFFEKAKDLGVFHFILFDSLDKIKKIEMETWYRTTVNNTQGIWIGNGITDQFTLKINKVTKEMRDETADNFGYVVRRGKATLVKIVEKYEKE